MSTLIIFVLGVLLHFTYNWLHQNPIVGLFSAVNESTWEHLKLLFFPMLLMSIIGAIYYKEEYPNYLGNQTKGIIVSLIFLIVFFYTYTGILGKSITLFNIGVFFVAVVIGKIYAYKKRNTSCSKVVSLLILSTLFFLFVVFTFFPLPIELFKDPITGGYGILK